MSRTNDSIDTFIIAIMNDGSVTRNSWLPKWGRVTAKKLREVTAGMVKTARVERCGEVLVRI